MKWRNVLLVTAALVTVAAHAWGWNEPAGFRDIPWGVTEESLRKKLDIHVNRCTAVASLLGDRGCKDGLLIGGPGGVAAQALFVFRGDSFVEVDITFKATDFPLMADIFTERYGPPTRKREESLKTPAGGEHTNTILEWVGTKAHVSLVRFAAGVSESAAVIETAAQREDKAKVRRERVKKGASDL